MQEGNRVFQHPVEGTGKVVKMLGANRPKGRQVST